MGFKDGKVLQLSKVCTIDGFTMCLIWASIAYVNYILQTLDVKKSYPCPEDLAEPHKG